MTIKKFIQFNENAQSKEFAFETKITAKNIYAYNVKNIISNAFDCICEHFYIDWYLDISINNNGIQSIIPNIKKIAGTIKIVDDQDNVLETLEIEGSNDDIKIKNQKFNIDWNIDFDHLGKFQCNALVLNFKTKKITIENN